MKQIIKPSPNYFRIGGPIRAVVLHGTAGGLVGSMATLLDPRPDNPDLAVSANYLIDKDGIVYELVDWRAGRRAWANGIVKRWDKSLVWLNRAMGGGINPNLLTISIEHVATMPEMITHASMTNEQFNASCELVITILRELCLPIDNQTVVGHNQINSVDKPFCPGVINIPAYIEVLQLRGNWYK